MKERMPRKDLLEDFIPVTPMGRINEAIVDNGRKSRRANVWCCFFDTQINRLRVAQYRAGGTDSFQFLHLSRLSNICTIKTWHSDPQTDYKNRVSEKRDEGFNFISGDWYIAPETGLILAYGLVADGDRERMNTRDVEIGGFTTQEACSCNKPPAWRRLQERLSEVNPVARTWFFAD